VTLDPNERELLAQFLRVAIVRLDIDRALEEERLVETIQLLLNRPRGLLCLRDLINARQRSSP
jgi:hypothetical protein